MRQILFIVLLSLFSICTIAYNGRPRKPIKTRILRAADRIELRQRLSSILNKTSSLSSTSVAQNIKHLVVETARKEVFAVYDEMLRERCVDYSSMKDKQSFIRDVWKITSFYLFQVDRLDMHNGCYIDDTEFPSIA